MTFHFYFLLGKVDPNLNTWQVKKKNSRENIKASAKSCHMHAGFHVTLSFSIVTISDDMRVKTVIADTELTCVANENYPVATSDYTFVFFFHRRCFLKKENKFSPSVKFKTPVRKIRRFKKCYEKIGLHSCSCIAFLVS